MAGRTPRLRGYVRIELHAQKAVGAWVAGLVLFAFAWIGRSIASGESFRAFHSLFVNS